MRTGPRVTKYRTDLEAMPRAVSHALAASLFLASMACARSANTADDALPPDTAAPVSTTPADSTATSPTDPDGPEGAAAVIREYYEAISAHDYRRAYLLWSDFGRSSNQTFDAFRAGYANTARASVCIGEPGRIEGAAGSRYIEIPVVIEATTTSDSTQRFAGTYALRRAVVDGATEAQMRWHIHNADIHACAPTGCP